MDTATNGTTVPKEETPLGVPAPVESKGKGKAVEQVPDTAMDEDDDEDEEEDEQEEPSGMHEEEDEDDLEEIEEDNIVGSRTRGKTIDYAKAAETMDEDEDYDEDDDEDFEEEDNDESMT
ncbi:hypothetical protein NA57DRAFT_77681 [Rhizodiscina lignyota]|uniref:Histone chaperone domain-containing protein n=1 Tax=Rhizodiscina lignyota TaxID=1504668 RepID=A0A9P4M4Y1_9PEZI|nr:hypothetical protein NA57DRAFT_77681 [Rhizodiscina lignyota]